MVHHVVIVGASYAGVAAMRRLGNRSGVHVTIIDRHPYHFLQTEGYDLISGTIPFDETIVSLHALCANYENVRFVHREVTGFDKEGKRVLCDKESVNYDTLIVALGSITRFFECDKDVLNYSGGAKSLRGALRLKQFFENELFRRLESSREAKESFNIVVGGAGLSGVEIAASMQSYFNRYYRSNTLSCASLHIHLIASRQTVLNGMHRGVIRSAERRLEDLGVIVHRNSRIASVHAHAVTLENKETIAFDFMIFAGGTTVAPVLSSLTLPRGGSGRFLVDAYLRSPEESSIYLVGDVAVLKDRKGSVLPPTAQTAHQSGSAAAENILRTLKGKAPKKALLRLNGIAIALGGHYATIVWGGLHLNGWLAYLIKKSIERLYKWPLWWLARKGYGKIEACEI